MKYGKNGENIGKSTVAYLTFGLQGVCASAQDTVSENYKRVVFSSTSLGRTAVYQLAYRINGENIGRA